MPSVLALIAKAVFEKTPRLAVGDRARMDRYLSSAKGLTPLADGGSLVLVTVRPGERLWLIAILDEPAFEETMWRSPPCELPITDVTELLPKIRLANGKGIQAPEGKLGMSLQTPRVLTNDDVALLRIAATGGVAAATTSTPAATGKPAATTLAKPARKPAAPAPIAPKPTAPEVPAPEIAEPVRVVLSPERRAAIDASTAELFAAVVAAPHDEAARRVLADKLMEEGDPHGEYIQLACDAEALPEGDARREALEAAALRLRRVGSLAFSRQLRAVPFFNESSSDRHPKFAFHRGFPDEVRGSAHQILPVLAAAVRASPVRRVTLSQARTTDVDALAALPELAQIRALSIQGWGGDVSGVVTLLRSPHLTHLEELELDCTLAAADVEALEACPALEGLRVLSLRASQSGGGPAVDRVLRRWGARLDRLSLSMPVSAETLATLRSLRHLRLSGVNLGAQGTALLARDPPPILTSLELSDCEIGDAKALAALAAGAFPHLARLGFDQVVTGKVVGKFLDALALPALVDLALDRSALHGKGAALLAAAAPKLAKLRRLSLLGAAIGEDGARALAAIQLPSLETLALSGNGLDGAGMAALAGGPLLATVKTLGLRMNKCHNDGAFALAKGPVGNVRSLDLYYNWMGVKGVRALLEATPLLEEIHAGENNYQDGPARFIASSTTLKTLRSASLEVADVGAFVRSAAAASLETLRIERGAIDEGTAHALAALPRLESLSLQVTAVDEPARPILRARFGPYLSAWAGVSLDALNAFPGPA